MVFCYCSKGKYVLDNTNELSTSLSRKSKRHGFINFTRHREESISRHPKSLEDEESIRKAIENNIYLHEIVPDDVMKDVIAAMYEKVVTAGELVIKQGDNGGHIYVSATGKFQTIVKERVMEEFEDVRVFGELAILYNVKRGATIKAMTPGKLWVLDSDIYQQIRYRMNMKEQQERMDLLLNNETLGVVRSDALQLVANLLKSEFFPGETEILKQGDKGEKFYIIRAGTVTVTKEGERLAKELKRGDIFGEYALLKDVRRQATITANGSGVECLTLDRKEFIRYFGEVSEFKYLKLPPKKDSIVSTLSETFADISLNDLELVSTLGVGGFGRVELVQNKHNKKMVFALKCLRKSDVVANNQQEHVVYERDIQKRCKFPFIVELYRTFSDDVNIYFLMETCMGGDLFNHLRRQKNGRFKEQDARFYFACVAEAISYLHSKEIIYRDLKPENLLLCSNGYLKLSDLGCAKKVPLQGKTSTFIGTVEYLAPEIIEFIPHNKAVDYWQCGVLIFDMLTSSTPFKCPEGNPYTIHQNILNGIDMVKFPDYIKLAPKHLIMTLCRQKPTERLGMDDRGVEAIKKHKWFEGFDWGQFQEFRMPPPFIPKLKGPLDTRWIEKCSKDSGFESVALNADDEKWFNSWDT